MIGRIIALIIGFFLLLVWLRVYIWIPIGLVLLYFIIRWCADIYWWLKDNYKGGGWF